MDGKQDEHIANIEAITYQTITKKKVAEHVSG